MADKVSFVLCIRQELFSFYDLKRKVSAIPKEQEYIEEKRKNQLLRDPSLAMEGSNCELCSPGKKRKGVSYQNKCQPSGKDGTCFSARKIRCMLSFASRLSKKKFKIMERSVTIY